MKCLCGKDGSGTYDSTEPEPITEDEILDEEYQTYKRVASAMCKTLLRPRDREICKIYLDIIDKYRSDDNVHVKKDLNVFFRYYLKILRWTSKNQPIELYQRWYCYSNKDESAESEEEATHIWLKPQHAYVAMKSFDDGTTIIYAAAARNPAAGWVEGGLKTLAKSFGPCQR